MTDNYIEPPIDELYEEEVEQAVTRSRFMIRDAAFALAPRPPRKYMIDKFLSEKTVNLVAGQYGSTKTYDLIDAGVCLAMGADDWLGLKTLQTNVLIIDEESGEQRLSSRLSEVLKGHLADGNTPIFFVSLAGLNLYKNEGDEMHLRALIDETQAGVVIIDALADIMLGGDENSVKDTQMVFHALRSIAEDTGCAFLVIHHTNKAGQYRGSSAIPGAIDTMVIVEKADKSNVITFDVAKNRDGEPFKFKAIPTWIEDKFFLSPADNTADEPSYGKAQSYVLRYLKEHGTASINEIMGSADTCTPASAKKATYSLASTGLVYRTNPSSNPQVAAIYALAENKQVSL